MTSYPYWAKIWKVRLKSKETRFKKYRLQSENIYRQKGSLKFLPSFKTQHTKYSKSVKLAVPCQENYPCLWGIPSQSAQNHPGPVCTAYDVYAAPSLHFFIRYSYIRYFVPIRRNYSFKRRLPFYVIYILWLQLNSKFKIWPNNQLTTACV